jgi:hypothetical protein
MQQPLGGQYSSRSAQGQLTPYIVSKAIAGDAKSEIVLARSDTDIMRAIIATENNWSPYSSRRTGREPVPNEELISLVAMIFAGKEGSREVSPQEEAAAAAALKGYSAEQIIASLPDDVIVKIFEFMFTGGEGDQEGNPGKEWITITIRPVPTPRSIYERFDVDRHRNPKLQQTFGGVRQPVISETRGGDRRRGNTGSRRREPVITAPIAAQPATFQPSIAPLQVPTYLTNSQVVNPLRLPVLGQEGLPLKTIVIPGLPQANPRLLDRRTIEDIVDGVEEAFHDGNYNGNYNLGGTRSAELVRFYMEEIERLAIAEGGVDKAVFARERAYADAYLRRAALRIMLDDDAFVREGGAEASLLADREVEPL